MKTTFFSLTIALLFSTIALIAMDNEKIPLENTPLITNVENQLQTYVSFSQLKKAIKNNNLQLAKNLLQKAQSQENAQEITKNLKDVIANCNAAKMSTGCSLFGATAGYALGATFIAVGIWMATKISQTEFYWLAVGICATFAIASIAGGVPAHCDYYLIKDKNSFIDFAQHYPEIIRQMNIELKKIDLTNQRKQLERDKKEIEEKESELKELIIQ